MVFTLKNNLLKKKQLNSDGYNIGMLCPLLDITSLSVVKKTFNANFLTISDKLLNTKNKHRCLINKTAH